MCYGVCCGVCCGGCRKLSLRLNMFIASWNVNSLMVRLEAVLKWLGDTKPDVLCLQETKLIDEKFPVDAFREREYYF